MAACVSSMFSKKQVSLIKFDFYTVDPKVFENLLMIINEKTKEKKNKREQ